MIGGVTRLVAYRIDRTAQTCTVISFQQALGGCGLNLVSGQWCLTQANVSADVAACENQTNPAGAVVATAASGTFSITTSGGYTLTLDVALAFPGGGGLPQTVQAQVTGCNANCTPRCGS